MFRNKLKRHSSKALLASVLAGVPTALLMRELHKKRNQNTKNDFERQTGGLNRRFFSPSNAAWQRINKYFLPSLALYGATALAGKAIHDCINKHKRRKQSGSGIFPPMRTLYDFGQNNTNDHLYRFLQQRQRQQRGGGLLLGKNSPFRNIPILNILS